MSQFAGKTAVISGGAEGIGLSIAQALGNQKMNIVIADIDQSNLEKARLELESDGVSVLAVALDVAQEDQWQEVANQAVAKFGKVHMVVNNAGVGGDTGPIESQDTKGWQWTLDVNLMGVVYGAKVMTPLIKKHGEGGWIVNVASMAGMGGIPYAGAYTATKAAVVALSESWAGELEGDGIHVSVLCPAFVQTRIYESARNRPEKYQPDPTPKSEKAVLTNSAKQMVESGIDVSIVGKRVVEALNDKEFYIFTHPNYRFLMQERTAAIDEAFTKSAKSPLLKNITDQKIEMP
ncbi:MAG: SDR family NAD(P)-dependent oxidoreductase [Gammaproteobacteria bacterium]|jgi:NAD(P)-dependent dehydrogenase (short-subunit alcohol dehydrogenase family)|nr:SDR family NAD(P)-dependent oxidoreductase [Gammaproteobacteria bacterium]|tara:strand:+ start:5168 stop:6043 length:876 start_codon:yes stop_codon:yes gene_type:complete